MNWQNTGSSNSRVSRAALLSARQFSYFSLLLLVFSLAWESRCAAADERIPRTAVWTNREEALRSYLPNMDRTGQDPDTLGGRLQRIEQALLAQHSKEMESLQAANYWMLIVAGAFPIVASLTVLILAWFQWKTVSRLAEISASPTRVLTTSAAVAAPTPGPAQSVSLSGPGEQFTMRIMQNLERLEIRLLEIERRPAPALEQAASGSVAPIATSDDDLRKSERGTGDDKRSRVQSLVGKGKSLVHLEKFDEALTCFNGALALEPNYAPAFLEKGAAFEKLGNLDEALKLYDQAIAADSSLSVAYVYKGGVYNRMQKFNEALECYEQALRKQEPART